MAEKIEIIRELEERQAGSSPVHGLWKAVGLATNIILTLAFASAKLLLFAVICFFKPVWRCVAATFPARAKRVKFKFMRWALRPPAGSSAGASASSCIDPWSSARLREGEALAPWMARFSLALGGLLAEQACSRRSEWTASKLGQALAQRGRLFLLENFIPWMDCLWRSERRVTRAPSLSLNHLGNHRIGASWEGWEWWEVDRSVFPRHLAANALWMAECGSPWLCSFKSIVLPGNQGHGWRNFVAPRYPAFIRCYLWSFGASRRSALLAKDRLRALGEANHVIELLLSGEAPAADFRSGWAFGHLADNVAWLLAGRSGFVDMQQHHDERIVAELEELALRLIMVALTGLCPEIRASGIICWIEGAWLSTKGSASDFANDAGLDIGAQEAFGAFVGGRRFHSCHKEVASSLSPSAKSAALAIIESSQLRVISRRLDAQSICMLAKIVHGEDWLMRLFLGMRGFEISLEARSFGQPVQSPLSAAVLHWTQPSEMRSMSIAQLISFCFANPNWRPVEGALRRALLKCYPRRFQGATIFDFVNLEQSGFTAKLDAIIEQAEIAAAVGEARPVGKSRGVNRL